MEGGHEHGREAVRSYWTRQWAMVDPHVEPVTIKQAEDGVWVVEVHKVVKDLEGNVLEDGLMKKFDLRLVSILRIHISEERCGT